jgi:hypothetical protein
MTACEQIEDAAEASMNESPGIPLIAVVDDDESVRESLAALDRLGNTRHSAIQVASKSCLWKV